MWYNINMKISYEDRKKWILDHQDLFIGKAAEATANDSLRKYKRVFEETTKMKYTPENEMKYREEHNITTRTFEEAYQTLLASQRNINTHLNDKVIVYSEESDCKEEVGGVDISDYLKEIRFNHEREILMFLFIKDGKVIDKYLIDGIDSTQIKISPKNYADILNKARELEAGVFDVHNHPRRFSARPSENDFKSIIKIRMLFEKYEVNLLDWGVVTEWDYYSNKQKENTSI